MKTAIISAVNQASISEWEAMCKGCEYATYFHTPRWFELIARYNSRGHGEIISRKITFSDARVAIVPLLRVRRFGGLINDYFCSASGTYGGWISEQPLEENQARELATWLRNNHRSLQWRENPYCEEMKLVKLPRAREEFTHAIRLDAGIEAIYENTTYAHKKALRKGQREGVSVRCAESIDDWKTYFELYRNSLLRWKHQSKQTRVVYGWELFADLANHPSQNEMLWLAVKDTRIIAGIVAFYWNHHVVTWHGAALSEYFPLRPNNLLYWAILTDAARKDFRWFDFNPSGGHEQVDSFKSQFGAQKLRSRFVADRSGFRALLARAKEMAQSPLNLRCN